MILNLDTERVVTCNFIFIRILTTYESLPLGRVQVRVHVHGFNLSALYCSSTPFLPSLALQQQKFRNFLSATCLCQPPPRPDQASLFSGNSDFRDFSLKPGSFQTYSA